MRDGRNPLRQAQFAPTLAAAAAQVRALLRPGDALLTLGAGDVWKVGDEVLSTEY